MTGGINDTKYVKTKVGMRIKEAREKKKLSRTKFSDFLNTFENRPIANGKIEYMNQERLKSWEYGDNPVAFEWIPLLCNALDCDVGYLFGDYPELKRTTSDVVSVTGLSELAVEKLAAIHKSSKDSAVWSCGSDVWSSTLRFLSFLLEGVKSVYFNDEPNIIRLVIKAHEAMEAASNAKKLEHLLNSKLAMTDAENSAWKNWDFTKELLDKEYDRTKVLDEARNCQNVYDAKLYHCEKMASALIAEYIKKGAQNG